MDTQHLDVLDRGERADDVAQARRRQHQGIAAGEDHLPDVRARADVIVGRLALARGQAGPALGAHHLAAEAEAAIDRAGVDELQQHPVGIAMHDPFDRAVGIIADRVGALRRMPRELRGVGNELARDRVVWIASVDQRGDRGRDRNGVARRDRLERGGVGGVDEAGRFEFRNGAKGRHCPSSCAGSGSGVQITWSIREAPVASMTRRSKPSAQPDACGISASAARKSSSIG